MCPVSKRGLVAFSFSLTCLFALAAVAATPPPERYPQRPVRIIVPVSAGGGVDSVARIIASHFNAVWGQPFIVDNRTGAGGSIGVEIAARAASDGYTLLVSSSSLVTNAAIREVRYDPIRDFQPISKLTTNPYILITTPALGISSVKQLVALAKSQPGVITYASSGTGGVLHLDAELLCALSGARMTHVPYKGVADGYPAVMSGEVKWMLGSPISALPLMKAGRLKGIAVTGAARSKALPDLPTIAESGFPGYEVSAWFALFAPARIPAHIINTLHSEARKAMLAPEIVRRMDAEGTGIVVNAPRAFSAEVQTEYDKWRRLVQQAQLKL